MNHIHFLSTNETVCENPKLLGHDVVVCDYSDSPTCKRCMALIMTHNEQSRKYDLLISLPEQYREEPMTASQGIMLGLALGTAAWVAIFVLIWAVFYG